MNYKEYIVLPFCTFLIIALFNSNIYSNEENSTSNIANSEFGYLSGRIKAFGENRGIESVLAIYNDSVADSSLGQDYYSIDFPIIIKTDDSGTIPLTKLPVGQYSVEIYPLYSAMDFIPVELYDYYITKDLISIIYTELFPKMNYLERFTKLKPIKWQKILDSLNNK